MLCLLLYLRDYLIIRLFVGLTNNTSITDYENSGLIKYVNKKPQKIS